MNEYSQRLPIKKTGKTVILQWLVGLFRCAEPMYLDTLNKLSQWDATLPDHPDAEAAKMRHKPSVIKRLQE